MATNGEDARWRDAEAIRRALVGLRRLFQRRELAQLWAANFGRRTDLDYFDVRLLDAVSVAGAQTGSGDATVGDVAGLLGVDPSRASRQVAAAVNKGLLTRAAVAGDARKVVLKVTTSGAKLQKKGSELARSRIELALDEWSAADRAQLAKLLARFVEHVAPPPEAES